MIITGTIYADNLLGTLNDDTIDGGNGHDYLDDVQGGNDLMMGGEGHDTILAGAGDDMIKGGDGDDKIEAGDGNDAMWGGIGNDTIDGGNGHDYLDDVQGGNDLMMGGEGHDTILSGAGDDMIIGGAEDDEVKGGVGDDVIYGDNYISNNSTVGENLVVNGSFEDYTVSYNHCYKTKTLSGWTTHYASGIDIKKNSYYNSASDGKTWVELEGYGNSHISQKIDTENGKQYQISFDYKGHSKASAYNNKIEVYWNDQLIDTITEHGSRYSSCKNGGSNKWKTYTYTLEASSNDSTSLTFKAVGRSYRVGGQLDNVEVREVYQDSLANKLGTEQVKGNDLIYGEDGNDRIYGGAGSDTIYGGTGHDTLVGTDSVNVGVDQEDALYGGSGADVFVLGDEHRGYYNSQGWSDCAVIKDFNIDEDTVQLHDSSRNYWLGSSNGNSYLYEYTNHGWEGVAMFENVELDCYDLKGSAFDYAN